MSRLLIFPKEHICILTGAFREDGTAVRTKSLRGGRARLRGAGSRKRSPRALRPRRRPSPPACRCTPRPLGGGVVKPKTRAREGSGARTSWVRLRHHTAGLTFPAALKFRGNRDFFSPTSLPQPGARYLIQIWHFPSPKQTPLVSVHQSIHPDCGGLKIHLPILNTLFFETQGLCDFPLKWGGRLHPSHGGKDTVRLLNKVIKGNAMST